MTNQRSPDKSKKPKFWNFRADGGGKKAELSIYGEIASYQSWWDDVTTPQQFAKELTELGDVDEITVRINSGGGDVFAAVAIFTRLKEHPANVTVIIDGWAASAATIIAMAGDTVKIPAAASFMIHNPSLGLLGYYGSRDLQAFVNELEVCKSCITNAYLTKSGKTKDEIAELMDAETWYTGEQAVDEGFCDEVLFTEDGGKPEITDATRHERMPKALLNGDTPPKDMPTPPKNRKEQEAMEIKTMQELQAAYPALVKEAEDNAAKQERTRIRDIEERTLEGFEELAKSAKYDKPQTAADFAMSLIAQFKKQGSDYLNSRGDDAEDSRVNEVPDAPLNPDRSFGRKGGKAADDIDKAIEALPDESKGGKR
jgi:ATP-dependent protease ClpP protease subunit